MINAQTRGAFKRFPMPFWLWRGITPSLLFLLGFASFVMAQGSLKVEWKEGRLSVIAEKEPLSQVLREVVKQTGIEVRGLEVLQENVSMSFSRLPLHEGLQRLLAQVNYVLIEKSSPQGEMRPVHGLIFRRLAPSFPETIPSEKMAQIKSEPKVEVMIPDQGGTQLEDEQRTETMIPDQGGTQLEDEQKAETMLPDQGGTQLEDEQKAETMLSDK